LFRADGQQQDERNDRIIALATLWSYRSLIGSLVILLTFVGFMPPSWRSLFDHFAVANLMVGTIVLSLTVRETVQLFLYADDAMGTL